MGLYNRVLSTTRRRRTEEVFGLERHTGFRDTAGERAAKTGGDETLLDRSAGLSKKKSLSSGCSPNPAHRISPHTMIFAG